MALRVPKAQGLPFIRLCSHESPRTPIYTAVQPRKPKDVLLCGSTEHIKWKHPIYMVIQAIQALELSFKWLSKPRNTNDFNLHGSTGHRSRRTPIHMALQAIKKRTLFFQFY